MDMIVNMLAAMPVSGGAVEGGQATTTDWVLLGVYLVMAVGVSFLCSMLEASLLTLTRADAALLTQQGRRAGPMLEGYLKSVDRPLTAILTLNTISHTFGAAGVGAQVLVIFGSAWLTLASVLVTLLILVLSEIIPKTLGAAHAKKLATFTAFTLKGMLWLLYPVVAPMAVLSGKLGGGHHTRITRAEVEVITQMGSEHGAIDADESRVIGNLLKLHEVRAKDVMTPRKVVFMLPGEKRVGDAMSENERFHHARMPVYAGSTDHVTGLVLRQDLLRADSERSVGDLQTPISVVPETASVESVMQKMIDDREHLLLVVDEFGGTAGVITLEDCVETLLGVEIMDETDVAADMRAVAKAAATKQQDIETEVARED